MMKPAGKKPFLKTFPSPNLKKPEQQENYTCNNSQTFFPQKQVDK